MNFKVLKIWIFLSMCAAVPYASAMFKFEEEDEDIYACELQHIIKKNDTDRIDGLAGRSDAQIVNMPDHMGKTLLGYAIEISNKVMVHKLLSEGANPNCETHGRSPLLFAVQKSTPEIVDMLLLFGAQDEDQYELFHEAIKRRSKHLINSLVRSGFDINVRAADKGFPLIDAVLGKDEDVIETCLRLGADREMRDGEGRTVLEMLKQLQKPRRGLAYSREHLRDIGDAIVDDPAAMARMSDLEIINFFEKLESCGAEGNQNLMKVKEHASRMAGMPVDEAVHYFFQLGRSVQREVAFFVPLHLRDQLKNSVKSISSPSEDNSSGCWIQ